MDVLVEASERWLDSSTAVAAHAGRPGIVQAIEDNIGGIAEGAVVQAGEPVNSIVLVRRHDHRDLGGKTDVLITVFAPWPDIPDAKLRGYMNAVRDQALYMIFDYLRRDRPRITVRVRLVKECEITVQPEST